MIAALLFLFTISVLVFVHEFGHFSAARSLGVQVHEFSVGLGKPVFSRQFLGTNFVFRSVPLGGFIKMKEASDGIPVVSSGVSFDDKRLLSRLSIILAGPVANLLFAWAILVFISLYSTFEPASVVGHVQPGSFAQKTGIQVADEVETVDGQFVETWADLVDAMAKEGGAKVIGVGGRMIDLNRRYASPEEVGISSYQQSRSIVLDSVVPGSPADIGGLRPGDRVLRVDDFPLPQWDALVAWLERKDPMGKRIDILVERAGQQILLSVEPEHRRGSSYLGIAPVKEQAPAWALHRKKVSLPDSMAVALKQTGDIIVGIIDAIASTLKSDTALSSLGGPVTIAVQAEKSAASGLYAYFNFAVLISVSLAVMNALPIPMLDGGQFALNLIEAAKGSALSSTALLVANTIGFTLIGGLMAIAFLNDFIYLLL
jgi:regulator of sigma E protease